LLIFFFIHDRVLKQSLELRYVAVIFVEYNVMLVKTNVVTAKLTSYSSCNRLPHGIYLTECRLNLLQ